MKRDDKRTMLLRAAEELFLRYGYRRTTLEDLSEAVGMRKSSLYHYFNGKDELFVETIRFLHQSVLEKVAHAMGSAVTIREAMVSITEILTYYVDRMTPEIGEITEKMSSAFPKIHDDYLQMITKLLDVAEARFNKAVEDGELKPLPAREVSLILLTLFNKAVVMKKMMPEFKKVAEEPEFFIDLVLGSYFV